MRILILGASGFIGLRLAQYALFLGHDVTALCRREHIDAYPGACVRWQLGEAVPKNVAVGAHCAVHLAYDFSGAEGAERSLFGVLQAVDTLCAAGVDRQIVFSSYSASDNAISLYGKTKRAMEKALLGKPGVCIARPGLVLGDGGIYGRIRKWARLLPCIPLPDGGRGLTPVISIERLCKETIALATAPTLPAEANLFESGLRSLRDIVLDAARENNRYPFIVPIPSGLMLRMLYLAALLRLPLPVNADNLAGFLANQNANHRSTLLNEIPSVVPER